MISSVLASAAGGFFLAASFPPLRFDIAAWIAFVPLFRAIETTARPWEAGLCGAAFGTAFFFCDLNWIYATLRTHGHFASAPAAALLVSMVLILALFPAACALLAAFFSSKGFGAALTAPFIWVALEYVRTVGLPDFPWDLMGYSQTERLELIQVVEVTGIYGVSFLILVVNGALWELLRWVETKQRPRWKPILAGAATLVVALGYGQARIRDFPEAGQPDGGCRIGVLQANIPQEIKWTDAAREHTLVTYERLGKRAVQDGARVLIWPETSIPVVFGSGDRDEARASDISTRLGVPMLVGAPSMRVEGAGPRFYNSAFIVDGPSLRFRYDKIHLVPFGEYMPWTWLLPLGPGIASREADFSPGGAMTVMAVDACPPFSVLICYEAIFPELSRLALRNGAKMLMNITNDGWFGDTAAPYQHLAMARVRSVENRVWLVRCANTGVSATFDPAGRTIKKIPLNEEGLFVVRVPGHETVGSFYTHYGDVFAWGCLGMVLVLGVVAAGPRRNEGTRTGHPDGTGGGPGVCPTGDGGREQ